MKMQRAAHHPRRLPDRADVIVIGAGAAGVFAMRELVQSGRTAICLEARNRIGGRIFTRRSLARHPIELGAEFVHGAETIVQQLIAEFGLTLVPHVGVAYSWLDGKLLPDSELPRPPLLALHEVRRLAERLRRAGQGATPLPAFLNTPELSEILARSAVTRRYLEQLIKNDHAVEPTVLTLEGWLEPDVTGYGENFHIDEGYSALLHRAVQTARLDIRLNRPVQRMPGSKIDAIHALHAGKAFKMVTSFRPTRGGRAFWPEGMAMLTSALDSQLHWPTSQQRRRGRRHLLTHLVGATQPIVLASTPIRPRRC